MGTIISDNLINAENVLLVEGEDDKIALEKLLPNMSDILKKAIQNGRFIIDYLGGSNNLSFKLSLYRNMQCKCHTLLDNDESGRRSGKKAESDGLATVRDITYTICNGSPNAELEDCYNKNIYMQIIMDEFDVNINCKDFKCRKKWSDRIGNCFLSQGKQWDDEIKSKVKLEVAKSISTNPDEVLNPHKRSAIDSLINILESMIKKGALI